MTSGSSPATRAGLQRPMWLDEFQIEAWERVTTSLDKLGILSVTDADAITLYCVTYGRWRKACAEISHDGTSVVSDSGAVKSNPASAVVSQCERQMMSLLESFGLTPASRSRVAGMGSQPRDALDEFLRRKA
jgi:P27 family predicted phage terminase small subunit